MEPPIFDIRHGWHSQCFFSPPGTSGGPWRRGNSMKSELIILRGLYAMTALAVVFGICALLLRAS
jgi:hypothetical protein